MAGRSRQRTRDIDPPALPPDLDPVALACGEVVDDTTLERRFLDGGDVNDRALRAITFDTVRFRRFGMQRARLRNLRVQDSRFELCDLSSSDWAAANLTRVEMVACKLLGLRADGALLHDVLFQECRAPYAAFASARCRAVRFSKCHLAHTSFMDADLSGVVFADCDLSGADMMGAKLAGADLRGSKIDGMRIGAREIQGVVVDTSQAAIILRGLGARVEDG